MTFSALSRSKTRGSLLLLLPLPFILVKETLDVQIHRKAVSLLTQGFYTLRRCLGASSMAKSAAVFVESYFLCFLRLS